MFNVVQGHCSQ